MVNTPKKRVRTPGSRKEESRIYYLKNRQRILQRSKEYTQKHPEISAKASRKHLKKMRSESQELYLWRHLRTRAKERNLDFNLDVSDIIVPLTCPVLGIPIRWDNKRNQRDDSPSVDRFDPTKGYIKGNINVISEKANRIKSNASSQEIRKVADWMDADVSRS